MITKIISGGQTGADRASMDIAIEMDISYGGWCPKGRIDEIGLIPKKYEKMTEIGGVFKNDKDNYDARTILNIKSSDGTIIFVPSIPLPPNIKDGTLLTIKEVIAQKKPFLLVEVTKPFEQNISACSEWVKEHNISTLNIAGPRESSSPGIYNQVCELLRKVLPELLPSPSRCRL